MPTRQPSCALSLGLLFLIFSSGCNGGTPTSKKNSPSSQDREAAVASTSCLSDYAERPCEILTEELLREAMPSTPATIEKQETKRGVFSCSYSWPSERKSQMTMMGRTIEIPENNQLSLSMVKDYEKDAQKMFRRAYLPTKEEQERAQKMFDKQLNKKIAEGKLDKKTSSIARGMLNSTGGLETRNEKVEDVATMASWSPAKQGVLYVLDGRTKFQVVSDISADSNENKQVAVVLAKKLLNACQ